MTGGISAPGVVGVQDQLAVCRVRARAIRQAGDQAVTVVESNVGHDLGAGSRAHHRLLLVVLAGCYGQPGRAEANELVQPGRHTVRAEVRNCLEHGAQGCSFDRAAVSVEDDAEASH
jgi:hypothetical protein